MVKLNGKFFKIVINFSIGRSLKTWSIDATYSIPVYDMNEPILIVIKKYLVASTNYSRMENK